MSQFSKFTPLAYPANIFFPTWYVIRYLIHKDPPSCETVLNTLLSYVGGYQEVDFRRYYHRLKYNEAVKYIIVHETIQKTITRTLMKKQGF